MIGGEYKAVKDMEDKYLTSQIKRREEGLTEEDQSVDKQAMILDIYQSYAKLEPQLQIPTLKKYVADFGKHSEKIKRAVFESLKIGYAKEMAKVQIYKNQLFDEND